MDKEAENMQIIEDRYRMLVEQVSDWIWEVDANGQYTYASPSIKELLGYSPSEVIGKTPFELMEQKEAKRIAPLFHYYLMNKLPIRNLENKNVHRDGHIVILETSGSPIIDENGDCIGYRGVDRDITKRKQAEARKKQLLDIIDASHDFIATLDIDGNGLYYNPAAQQILGNLGDNTHLTKWADHQLVSEGIHEAIEKGFWKGETTIRNQVGEEIPVSQIVVAHKTDDGEVEFLSTIAHDISDRKKLEQVIQKQANYDILTNLPNRRYFYKRLSNAIARSTKEKKTALLFIDLDNFKRINDNFGHETGDKCLKMTAERLKQCIQVGDFVCRYGGDEFIVILENRQDISEIKSVAQDIIQSLIKPYKTETNTFNLSGSVGVSVIPDDGRDEHTVIQKADHAMYEIKRAGKSNYKFSM